MERCVRKPGQSKFLLFFSLCRTSLMKYMLQASITCSTDRCSSVTMKYWTAQYMILNKCEGRTVQYPQSPVTGVPPYLLLPQNVYTIISPYNTDLWQIYINIPWRPSWEQHTSCRILKKLAPSRPHLTCRGAVVKIHIMNVLASFKKEMSGRYRSQFLPG